MNGGVMQDRLMQEDPMHEGKMRDRAVQDRGSIQVDSGECKGCGLCIEACPPKVISLNEHLNHFGYRTAIYAGTGCSGCGICFFACPEPGAITVLRVAPGAANLGNAAMGKGAEAAA